MTGSDPPKYVLQFQDVCYDVNLKGGKDGVSTKRILHNLTSSCSSGRLTAVMGPSGAGKSSLLDILAGVKVSGKVRGKILLNGVTPKEFKFSSLCSYVQQKDVLVPSATVREALVTSALLKLPRSMPYASKRQRVEDLLQLLELSHVADSYIGDEALGIKGISGGEKRRVSVGVEVVKDPAIIFLDEPTTGLDSEMALGVIKSLQTMAQAGKMVVATIHQPNSLITDHFDDWMLLAKGKLLYTGPWRDAVAYFEQRGYPCPLYRNPTDFFMSLASNADSISALSDAFEQHSQHWQEKQQAALTAAAAAHTACSSKRSMLRDSSSEIPWKSPFMKRADTDTSTVYYSTADDDGSSSSSLVLTYEADTDTRPWWMTADNGRYGSSSSSSGAAGAGAAAGGGGGGDVELGAPSHTAAAAGLHGQMLPAVSEEQIDLSCWGRSCSSYGSSSSSVPMWYQIWVLMVRMFRTWLRTPIMAAAEAAQYLILAVFLGLLYLRQPPKLPDAPYDRMSAIFIVLTLLSFTPSYTVLVMWDHERQLLRRETSTKMYSRTAFFLAKTLTTTPIEVIQVTVFAVACYYMFGFQAVASKFAIWWAVLVIFALCSETLGYMAAIVTPDSKVGVAVLSIILILLMSFCGYLVRQIPVYFAWIPKISYFSFATDALVTNEFTGLKFAGPGAASSLSVMGETLIPDAMKTGLSVGGNLGVLLGIMIGCRIACLLLLEVAARFKFL